MDKHKLALGGAAMWINPDLVFARDAVVGVGDVKYKLSTGEWNRPDLYETVAFAAGFRVHAAIVVTFARSARSLSTVTLARTG